jgi:hypothetical protein
MIGGESSLVCGRATHRHTSPLGEQLLVATAHAFNILHRHKAPLQIVARLESLVERDVLLQYSAMRFLHLIRPVMCVLPEVASPDRKVSRVLLEG